MWVASCLASCCATCACEACQSVVGGISRRSARIAYRRLFALSLIISWILREVVAPLMEKLPYNNVFEEVNIVRPDDFYQSRESDSGLNWLS